ncbi:1,2-dihydroxy-3-keto-5-methylthiopentene dioxygenase [Cuniculiplasma sp. SKW4]|uniref:1,2-dihydroxy-3-keto-5-methylthiopentene dioxygenase n=1 Tax=Cuniculiplasma sp. SKW4 TaxID=3400171 RepID=UPI003FD49229
MVKINLKNDGKIISEYDDAEKFLKERNIRYDKWDIEKISSIEKNDNEILRVFNDEIEALKEEGNYLVADVINIDSKTPNLEIMLEKFKKEHVHSEDEVRFTIDGSGIFYINMDGKVFSIEVEPGDLLGVPAGTKHWFDLCQDKHIIAIRLFKDKSGWTPYYTNSGVDRKYEPVCFGPSYIRYKSH